MAGASEKRAFALRIRPDVLAAVEKLAAAELRSVNAEIEVLLREALDRRGVTLGRTQANTVRKPG